MKLFLSILFLLSIQLLSQDSTKIDSSFIYQEPSCNSKSIQKIYITNEDSFIQKYEGLIGAFVGAFFAAFIAIRSIKKTHQNQINLENEKIKQNRFHSEKVYCGFLFSIRSVLLNHKQFLSTLEQELNVILDHAKNTGKLPYDKPYTLLSVDLLKGNLNNVLSYENYNSKNVQLLITYLNFVELLYNDLNFTNLIKLKNDVQNVNDYQSRINGYFENVVGRTKLLADMVEELLNAITEEINHSETSRLFF